MAFHKDSCSGIFIFLGLLHNKVLLGRYQQPTCFCLAFYKCLEIEYIRMVCERKYEFLSVKNMSVTDTSTPLHPTKLTLQSSSN